MTQKITTSNTYSKNSLKRSAEWPVFEQNLATALKSMQEDEFLVISQKRSNLFVQFAAHGEFGMRVSEAAPFSQVWRKKLQTASGIPGRSNGYAATRRNHCLVQDASVVA